MLNTEKGSFHLEKKAVLKFADDQPNTQACTALLPISVGQSYHEGEEFLSLLMAVNKKFLSFSIMVVDTLQRHTLSMTEDEEPESLRQKTRDLGDRWLNRNIQYIRKMKKINKIMWWDDWLGTDQFLENYQRICDMYNRNAHYKNAANETVAFFMHRFFKKYPEKLNNRKQLEHRCLEYLKEECAIMPLWASENFHYEVYPKIRNEAMRIIYEILVKPFYPDSLRPVSIKFKKITSQVEYF